MLDIKGQDVRLWINPHEGRSGTWYSYSTSISKKVDDKYVNKYVKLILSKDIKVPSGLENGSLVDFEGFPMLDVYTDRDEVEHREVAIFVKKMTFKDVGDYEGYQTVDTEDIPF